VTEQDLASVDLPAPTYTPAPPQTTGFEFGSAVDSAYRSALYDWGSDKGQANAISQAADTRNFAIQRATGASLENPAEGGYEPEARARQAADEQSGKFVLTGVPGADAMLRNQAVQRHQLAIYQEKLNELAAQYPDHAETIGAQRPIMQDANAVSQYWSERAARGEPGLNAVAGLGASLLGGAAGALRRDPLTQGALLTATGGEISVAKSALGQAVEGGLRLGAANTALQAVQEPLDLEVRGARGEEISASTVGRDLAMAFGVGFVPGAGLPLAKLAFDKLAWGRLADAAVLHGEGVGPLPEKPATAEAPQARAAEHLAGLDPAAQAEAQSGKISRDVALATAARVDGDGAQLAVMRDAMRDAPKGPDEAAQAVTRAMESATTPDAVGALRGLDEATPSLPKPSFHRDAEGDFAAQTDGLKAELSAKNAENASISPSNNRVEVIDKTSVMKEFADPKGGMDMAVAGDAVEKRVEDALSSGAKVRLVIPSEGKSLNITQVSKSGLRGLVDEQGNPWGVYGAIMFPKPGSHDRIEISYPDAAPAHSPQRELAPPERLLDGAPDAAGAVRDQGALIDEKTREQMLADVVRRCPF
jgi:hypothetical protein